MHQSQNAVRELVRARCRVQVALFQGSAQLRVCDCAAEAVSVEDREEAVGVEAEQDGSGGSLFKPRAVFSASL